MQHIAVITCHSALRDSTGLRLRRCALPPRVPDFILPGLLIRCCVFTHDVAVFLYACYVELVHCVFFHTTVRDLPPPPTT